MKRKDRIVVWPIYFDSTKSRAEGRCVPKSLSVSGPKLDEILKAIERSGLQAEAVPDVVYPSDPLRKTGVAYVPKKGPKTRVLREIGEQLVNIRGEK